MIRMRPVYPLFLLALRLCAQAPDSGGSPVPAGEPPIRIDVGGYGEDFNSGIGWWRGLDTTVWFRQSPRFVPALTFDQRTSDAGTQRYYSFFSYANWSNRFYTTQSIAGVPVLPGAPLLFPRFRADFKPWLKIGTSRRVVVGVGLTKYSFNSSQQGFVLNPGLLYYRGAWVFDWEAFANSTDPGRLWSGSGQFSLQQGHEGRHWVGLTLGAGRQVYRALSATPLEVSYSSESADVFYRQWLTRHFGFVASGGYLDARQSYHRTTASFSLFFEF